MRRVLFLLASVFALYGAYGQSLSGEVTNSQNGNPLAFVNILFDQSGGGVSSDIDGHFKIENINEIEYLRFTYVGFYDTIIAVKSIKGEFLKLRMCPKNYLLSEVKITSGENPAHRIVQLCVKNRKYNNPEKRTSFSYRAYHKMIFTAASTAEHQSESIAKGKTNLSKAPIAKQITGKDTSINTKEPDGFSENIFKNQHLFVMESVSERSYQRPDKNYEKVIGTKVSGLKDPFFVMIATQFQSFSFYKPSINILDKNYINPISQGSIRKYYFILEDTIFQGKDSVFVISFRPYKGTNFDGLKGVLYINSNHFAIQNVIAEPAKKEDSFGVKIQQKYEQVKGGYWFPVQLNTNIEFYTINLNDEQLVGIGKSYLREIKVNESMKGVHFSNIVLDIDNKAAKQDSTFWERNRVMQLDSLELKTYEVLDSISETENLDKKLWVLLSLSNGYIPVGAVNMEIDKFIQFNNFEGFRLGLSLKTNEIISRRIQIGAYAAYGFSDYQWKYGGSLDFTLHQASETRLSIQYKHDVAESAAQETFSSSSFYNSDLYRNFLIREMNYMDFLKLELGFRALNNFSWKLAYQYFEKSASLQSAIPPPSQSMDPGPKTLFQEVYVESRFAYKEKIVRNQFYRFSLGTKYPVLNLRYTYGAYANESDINTNPNYSRIEAQLSKSFFIRFLGKSSFTLRGGRIFADKNIPWYQLYNGRGSYARFYLESPNSFGTMRMNEFLSDQYISVFYRHDFGSLLFGDKRFVPHPELITNFTIGLLSHQYNHLKYRTLEKGYFESGIMFNSILKSGISSIGIGFMYRYGPYALPTLWDNFSYKFTLGFAL